MVAEAGCMHFDCRKAEKTAREHNRAPQPKAVVHLVFDVEVQSGSQPPGSRSSAAKLVPSRKMRAFAPRAPSGAS